jgi:predicted DNA-binding transcriptional regulator YafY
MLQTSARLLRLLTTLQGRRSWSGPELAERLEITARTLRRDIDRLRTLGYPVHSTAGVAGGYSLGAGAQLPPLMLDDDEGVAIAVALQTAAVGGVAHIDDAAQRALAKLDQLLPARARKRLKAVRSSIVRLGQSGPMVELEAVSALAAACSEQISVSFDYKDQAGKASRRDVEPHRVVHMERRWYLVAWDQLRSDWRTFRIDRLSLPIERRKAFAARSVPDNDVATYVRRSISVMPYPHRVRVRLPVPFSEARARIGMRHGVLSPIDEHSCRFETGADSLEHVATWIAMLGFDFTIEEPTQLSEAIAALAARLTRALQG